MAAWRGDLGNPQNVHYHNGAPPLLFKPKWIRLAFLGMGTLSTLFFYYFRSARTGVLSLSPSRIETDNPRKKRDFFER